MPVCSICGRATEDHDRQVRFRVPEPVLHIVGEDTGPGVWRDGPDANRSTMMVVPDVGAFVRSLLPVTLTGGHKVTFGVWVAVQSPDLQRAFEIWWEPEYASLKLDGLLANRVPPWEVFGAPVSIAVLNLNETPYCVDSADAELHRVLTAACAHDEVLQALPN